MLCIAAQWPVQDAQHAQAPAGGGRIFIGLAREFFRPAGGQILGPWFRGFAANNAASPTAKSSPALAGLVRIVRRFLTRKTNPIRLTEKWQQLPPFSSRTR